MTKTNKVILWGILLLISSLFYWDSTFESPGGRHASGMSNNYAIALRFIDSGFDFFHPKSYCLNPQFAPTKIDNNALGHWGYSPENPEGITAVDFPIHQYLIAHIMDFFDSNSYAIYRLYMLILSLLGLYYLGLGAYVATHSFLFSIALVVGTFLSPAFSYFANSYLVSSAALSFFFIGSYFYIKATKEKSNTARIISYGLLTISALTRFPFVIFIIACFLNALIAYRFKNKPNRLDLTSTSLSLLTVLAYFCYNKFYLNFNYGSIFLHYPNPPKNALAFVSSILRIITHKSWYYGTLLHYLILFILLKTVARKFNTYVPMLYKNPMLRLLSLSSGGVIMYSLLMLNQFAYHDYYILDTYLPLVILWIIAMYRTLPVKTIQKFKKHALLLFTGMFILNVVTSQFDKQYRADRPIAISGKKYKNAYLILDSLDISKSAKLLVLNASGSNMPLLSFRRQGFSIVEDNYQKTSLKKLQHSVYNYVITPDSVFPETIIKNYPKISEETKVFFSNDKFTIHQKK